MNLSNRILRAVAIVAGSAAPAAAQSDPSLYDFVYNIGTPPAGSTFDINDNDIPGTLTNGTRVGDGDTFFQTQPISPGVLNGDTLGSNSQLNLFDGGEILRGFSAGAGSDIELNVFGGVVGSNFNANSGSTVNISGGTFGNDYLANLDSTTNISGGTISGDFISLTGTVNIAGGTFDGDFNAVGGEVNLFGTEFFLDGVELTDLQPDRGFVIRERGVTLSGLLADGSAFEFDVTDDLFSATDYFDPRTMVTVTLVPAPPASGAMALIGIAAVRRRRG